MRLRIPEIRKLQWTRRCVQWMMLLFIVAIPLLGRYGNYLASRELDAVNERWRGTLQGSALEAVDSVVRALPGTERERAGRIVRNDGKILEFIGELSGNAWSAEVYGVSFTDPLAAAESFAASRRIVNAMIVGLVIPLVVTLLLGRVFCSWLCPMNLFLEFTDKLRRLLRFLELPAFNARFPRATKYIALGCGLFLAWHWAVPVLGSFYPPAIVGRELRGAVNTVFDRAEDGLFGWSWRGLTAASLFILGIALFEILVSRRWWCRYVCPGGALYSLLGRFRIVRVVRDADGCTSCGDCVRVCPMGLAPMHDKFGTECDNCGLCISHCGDDALGYRLTSERREKRPKLVKPTLVSGATALLITLLPAQLAAHHILGIPHYAYDESYPQAPVITYRTEAGEYDVRMTGYPGRPVPGQRTSLHVYITHRSGSSPYRGAVTLRVFRDNWFGEDDTVYGPVTAELSESLHKFFPTFDREDDYMVRVDFSIDGVPWSIDLPVVVGEPGSPVAVAIGFIAGIVFLLIVVRAVRIKMDRRRSAE